MNRKPDWLYQQSAAIPYYFDSGKLQIVLINKNAEETWIYPKGVIERDLSPESSAAKEALEEAGVTGFVSDLLLGTYLYEKWDGVCSVKVYPLEVTELLEDWEEKGKRNRIICDAKEARIKIRREQKPALLELIKHLK